MKEMQPKCIILCGIPCSGKSTWSSQQEGYKILSRDDIREELNPGKYKFDPRIEDRVTDIFNARLRFLTHNAAFIILDNTHCKQKYIDQYRDKIPEYYSVEVKYFDIPLWKAKWRNIIRWIKTGKWIPMNVMNNMYKNYKKLKRYE